MYHTWMVWECTFCSNQIWQPFPFIEHNMCGIGPSPTLIWNSQLRFSRLYIPQSGCNAQEDEDVPPLLHRRSNMLTEQPRNPQGCRYNVCHSQDQPCNSKRIIFTLDFKLAVLSHEQHLSLTSLVDIEIRVEKNTIPVRRQQLFTLLWMYSISGSTKIKSILEHLKQVFNSRAVAQGT